MVMIPIVVFHSGQWDDQHCYVNYTTIGVLVDEVMSFENFLNLILKETQFNSSICSIELSVLLDLGNNGVQNVVKILEDKDVTWFLTLVKDQSMRYPLVAHAVNMLLETSSSGVNMLLEASSSGVSSSSIIEGDLEIFRDVHISNISCTLHFKEKDVFASKEILLKAFQFIAIKNNFEFKTLRSNSNSVEFECTQDGCQWYVRGSRYRSSDLWMIRKYVSEHNCSLNINQSSHRQASSLLISNCMVESLRFSSDHSTPKDIVNHMRMNYGVSVSYYKAWRARETIMKLLNGDAGDSYALIPKFFSKLKEMNPGNHWHTKFVSVDIVY